LDKARKGREIPVDYLMPVAYNIETIEKLREKAGMPRLEERGPP
jgi:hypothetical protein